MSPDDPDAASLWDLLEAARQTRGLAVGLTREAALADVRTRLALERSFEIMGEAARSVSEDGRRHYAEIPWRGIIGMRNVVAHKYGAIDYAKLWEATTVSVPLLIAAIERIFGEGTKGER
jgi:uncharacterized protein with HEPN domain